MQDKARDELGETDTSIISAIFRQDTKEREEAARGTRGSRGHVTAPEEAPGPRTSKAVPGRCLAPHQVSGRAAERGLDMHTGRRSGKAAPRTDDTSTDALNRSQSFQR